MELVDNIIWCHVVILCLTSVHYDVIMTSRDIFWTTTLGICHYTYVIAQLCFAIDMYGATMHV